MKKSILILGTMLIALCLSVVGYTNWQASPDSSNEVEAEHKTEYTSGIDLIYKVDSRFYATITKARLQQATTVLDLIPPQADWSKITFLDMKITVMEEAGEVEALGENEVLNAAQLMLLNSVDYSTHFYINTRVRNKDGGNPDYKMYGNSLFDLAYYITVIPEQEAVYADGYDALIDYLKENSQVETALIREDKLEAGRVNFTVTPTGALSNIEIESTSGYPLVDMKLVQLLNNLPGNWAPARNGAGEAIAQNYVFFFGKEGC